LELKGDGREGYYETLSIRDGVTGDIADGLTFEPSLDGLLAAFFLRAALLGHLAWGHSRYDRDQEFIFTQERTIAILEHDKISVEDDAGLRAITVPAGLRFCREEGGTLTLKCLTYCPGKGFYDCAVSVAGGCALAVQKTKLYQCSQRIFY
jgi:hypothetical protein